MILAAGEGSREALEHLAGRYWRPIYGYIRLSGRAHHEAEDLTQEFFAFLIENRTLARADPQRGRFRAFMRTCLRNFLGGERRREQAGIRGGGRKTLSLDVQGAEALVAGARGESPEEAFDRIWALDMLQRAVRQLKEQVTPQAWEAFVMAEGTPPLAYLEIGERLGLTANAAAASVSRSRRKMRELIISEVQATLEQEADYEGELTDLFRSISTSGSSPSSI